MVKHSFLWCLEHSMLAVGILFSVVAASIGIIVAGLRIEEWFSNHFPKYAGVAFGAFLLLSIAVLAAVLCYVFQG